jgi:hypothetical protein
MRLKSFLQYDAARRSQRRAGRMVVPTMGMYPVNSIGLGINVTQNISFYLVKRFDHFSVTFGLKMFFGA